MGDAFINAFAKELERTQRILASSCLFCVPQARSLATDSEITQEDIYTHFLTPISSDSEHQPGQYHTLNGKSVSIIGSHILTGKGFAEERKVRILLTETREISHQEVTVLHLSRPFERGIALPEDPNEIDVATFRRYTAILRSFPENELVFYNLDQTIAQVKKICTSSSSSNLFFTRYEHNLPSLLREEWEAAVEEILLAGALDGNSHLLPIQQVVECYLMENTHACLFEKLQVACYEEERKLAHIMYQMRHFGPQDFGIRKEFQCLLLEAQEELIGIKYRKTPLDMLLGFKSCIDIINDAVVMNLKAHRMDLSQFQMTTDDILDQLLWVLIQTFNASYSLALQDTNPSKLPAFDMSKYPAELPKKEHVQAIAFPIVSIIKYITEYHFINSNTTALGFTIANFQVAIEYFLLKYSHLVSCFHCLTLQIESPGDQAEDSIEKRNCSQPMSLSACEMSHHLNWIQTKAFLSKHKSKEENKTNVKLSLNQNVMRRLFILGEWTETSDVVEEQSVEEGEKDQKEDQGSTYPSGIHVVPDVQWESDEEKIIQVSGGHRFFAVVTDQGKLFTWGDTHGGRLGHPMENLASKRLMIPKLVSTGALDKPQPLKIVQVACGAFHTLVSDVNGHVYAWGKNSRGQLGVLCHSFELPSSSLTASVTAPPIVTSLASTCSTSSTEIHEPTHVADLKGTYITSIACGEYHSLALSSQGQVFSWGCNKYSKLGRETKSFLDTLHPKAIETNWKSSKLQGNDSGAIAEDAEVQDDRGVVVLKISAGKDHSMAITSEYAAFTWGRGDDGQLGQGSFMDVSIPIQVMALSEHFQVVDMCGGNSFSVFVTKLGFVYFCGYQGYRLIRRTSSSSAMMAGQGTNATRNFKQVFCHALCPELLELKGEKEEEQAMGNIISVSAGESHFALLTSEGKVLLGIREDISSDSLVEQENNSEKNLLDQSNAWRIKEAEGLEGVFVQRLAAGASHTLVVV